MSFPKILLSAATICFLNACGGGGASTTGSPGTPVASGTRTLSGAVVKGPVGGANVCLYEMNGTQRGNQVGACSTTDSNGNYAFTNVSGDGPFLVESTGGSYTDEVSNVPVSLSGANEALKTIAFPAQSATGIVLTPFTSIIANEVARILGSAGTVTTNVVGTAQSKVKTDLNLPANLDLLADSPVFGTNENTYGLALRTISQMIANGRSLSNILATTDAATLSADYSTARSTVESGSGSNNTGGGSSNTGGGGGQPSDASASGNVTVASTTMTRENFVPDSTGIKVKASDSTPTVTFEFSRVNPNNLAASRGITIAEAQGYQTTVGLLDAGTSFRCNRDCAIRKTVAPNTRGPILFELADSPLTPTNNTNPERITLNGSLTADVSAAWLTLDDIPKTTQTTDLRVSVNSGVETTQDVLVGLVSASGSSNDLSVVLNLDNGDIINLQIPAGGASSATGSYTSQAQGGQIHACFNNCGITLATTADSYGITLTNSNFSTAFSGSPSPRRVSGTVTVRRPSGFITTTDSSLTRFDVLESKVNAENELRTMIFSRPELSSPSSMADGLATVTVLHRNRVIDSVSISGRRNGNNVSYVCNASAPSGGLQPQCSGITVDNDQRTVTFTNATLRDIFANGSSPSPTTVVNGTLVARGR